MRSGGFSEHTFLLADRSLADELRQPTDKVLSTHNGASANQVSGSYIDAGARAGRLQRAAQAKLVAVFAHWHTQLAWVVNQPQHPGEIKQVKAYGEHREKRDPAQRGAY
ncbi:hypothetical protein [uncultured Caballeronia sp.]|uniref:hypothetical protein n=1 Tax=uncultured Caballeronia sp. TaxID=1827198 RepID=UPI0035CC35AA